MMIIEQSRADTINTISIRHRMQAAQADARPT
jgi:hypothetical protein